MVSKETAKLVKARTHWQKGFPPAGSQQTEPWEIIYFKLYKSQLPVIEQALETAALMLGTDKSRGYCLEMICADFLAGANLENGNPDGLLLSLGRLYEFPPRTQKEKFLGQAGEAS